MEEPWNDRLEIEGDALEELFKDPCDIIAEEELADFLEKEKDVCVAIGYCERCLTPVYSDLGFCGVCHAFGG